MMSGEGERREVAVIMVFSCTFFRGEKKER